MNRIRETAAAAGTTFLVGGALGVAVASVDHLRSRLGIGEGFEPWQFPWAVVWCATVSAVAGAVVGGMLGAFGGRRWAIPVLTLGTAATTVIVLLNHLVLPSFTSPLSLATDLAVLGAAAWGLTRWRRTGLPEGRRAWRVAAAVCTLPLALAAWLFGSGSEGKPATPPVATADVHPNVLLLVVDTLRADHTSLHGYERETTPNLDRFADECVVYTQARVPSPWTVPTCASLLTGLSPAVHTADTWTDALPDDAVTVAEELRAAGYRTGLVSDNPLVGPPYRLHQGFETVDARQPPFGFEACQRPGVRGVERLGLPRKSLLGLVCVELLEKTTDLFGQPSLPERRAELLVDRFLEWVDEGPQGRPWFGYLHFIDPHSPYDAPGEWDGRWRVSERRLQPPRFEDVGVAPFRPGIVLPDADRRTLIDQYDGEIGYWDHAFGRLVAAMRARGLFENTVVVVTADHGEAFYEHGIWVHRNGLYDELVHVPLLLRAPGLAPARSDAAVSLLGVARTLMQLSGHEARDMMALEAAPLLPLRTEAQVTRGRLNSLGCVGLSLVENGLKWILSTSEGQERLECYDLAADPGETRDLAAERPQEAARARAAILDRAAVEMQARLTGVAVDVTEEVADALRGLGYVR